jgi:peptidyl-prolyl cis-trans isomerase SurA
MRSILSLLLVSGLSAGLAPSILAQQAPRVPVFMTEDGELVNRVAAVVGDSVVLLSEVHEQIEAMRARGAEIPVETEPFRQLERQVLEELVRQQLVLQAAARDTLITVSDERVDQTLRAWWDEQIRSFGDEDELRRALEREGETVISYRSRMRDMIRRELLRETYLQSRRQQARRVPIEEAEILEFYEREREALTERPATIAFRQALVQPQPSDSAMAEARAEAERVLGMLRDGEDFAALARRLSDDPGSRQQGGELGWFRRGSNLDRDFEDAAFQLREGATAGPVETSFGAHIIKVERVRGPERKIHHILVAAGLTDQDVERARERAWEIRRAVEAGRPIGEFTGEQAQFGLPDSLEVAQDQLGQLPSGYAQALRDATPGEVLGPVELRGQAGQVFFVVIEVASVREAGEYGLDDLRPEIVRVLREEKFQRRLLEDLRARTYVEIRL